MRKKIMKIISYRIAMAGTAPKLELAVIDLMAKDWQPLGPACATAYGEGGSCYFIQTMVKYEDGNIPIEE